MMIGLRSLEPLFAIRTVNPVVVIDPALTTGKMVCNPVKSDTVYKDTVTKGIYANTLLNVTSYSTILFAVTVMTSVSPASICGSYSISLHSVP